MIAYCKPSTAWKILTTYMCVRNYLRTNSRLCNQFVIEIMSRQPDCITSLLQFTKPGHEYDNFHSPKVQQKTVAEYILLNQSHINHFQFIKELAYTGFVPLSP